MKVEILVFDGCPNAKGAEQLVHAAMKELNVAADIEVVKVIDNEDAVAKRFLGSPSIRIDGKDLEVEEDESTQYSMRCRVYRHGESQSGVPSLDLLRAKISEAAKQAP